MGIKTFKDLKFHETLNNKEAFMRFENGNSIRVTKFKGESGYHVLTTYIDTFMKGELSANDFDKTEKEVTAYMKGLQIFKQIINHVSIRRIKMPYARRSSSGMA